MNASDVAAWVGLAVGLVSLFGAMGSLLVIAWKGGAMANRLERAEEETKRFRSEWPRASADIARLDERTARGSSQVDPEELKR